MLPNTKYPQQIEQFQFTVYMRSLRPVQIYSFSTTDYQLIMLHSAWSLAG